MDNTKVNIINGAVVGVHLGAPMQDATPDKPEDNEAYATERNTETRLANSNTEETLEKQPEPVGGGLTELPEGYPYKEQSETVIEWDGNTEGLDNIGGRFFLVSPTILSNDEIKNGVVTGSDGFRWIMAEHWDTYVSVGYVAEDYVMVADGYVIFVRKAGAEVMGIPIEKPGVYFMNMNGNYIESFTTSSETIYTMAEEFMPLLTSPNGTKYKLTVSDDGALSAVKA